MFINKEIIGGFEYGTYFSSEEIIINHLIFGEMNCAWGQTFSINGVQHYIEKKKHKCFIRLVKSI